MLNEVTLCAIRSNPGPSLTWQEHILSGCGLIHCLSEPRLCAEPTKICLAAHIFLLLQNRHQSPRCHVTDLFNKWGHLQIASRSSKGDRYQHLLLSFLFSRLSGSHRLLMIHSQAKCHEKQQRSSLNSLTVRVGPRFEVWLSCEKQTV